MRLNAADLDQDYVYAGFWKRFVAFLIDSVLVGASLALLIMAYNKVFDDHLVPIPTFDVHFDSADVISSTEAQTPDGRIGVLNEFRKTRYLYGVFVTSDIMVMSFEVGEGDTQKRTIYWDYFADELADKEVARKLLINSDFSKPIEQQYAEINETLLKTFGVEALDDIKQSWGLPYVDLIFLFAYLALMEGARAKATFGKQVFGLKVTDASGQPLGFVKAIGRNLLKLLSFILLFIGVLMVAFTKRKRGLHDIISKTLVLTEHGNYVYREMRDAGLDLNLIPQVQTADSRDILIHESED